LAVTAVLHLADYIGSSTQQLDAYLSLSTGTRMARRVGYQFVHNHSLASSDTTAAVKDRQQARGVFPSDPASNGDREAELAKIGRCVDQSIGFWHLKCAMDIRIRVEESINGTDGHFSLFIAGMCGSERHRADCGSIFVV
jgi:hypothetical protein